MSQIGKKIESLLQEIGITQRELAKRVGITETTISRYVHGLREPKADIISKIAKVLATTSDYLLGNGDSSTSYNYKDRIAQREKLPEELKGIDTDMALQIVADSEGLTVEDVKSILNAIKGLKNK